MKRGERLKDVDPEFARLVSALKHGGPKRSAVDKTIALVASGTPVAMHSASNAPRPLLSSRGWVGLGVTVLALSSLGYVWGRDEGAPSYAGAAAIAESDAPALAPENSAPVAEPPAASTRVEDLPSAPVASAKPKPAAPPAASGPEKPSPSGDAFRDELALVERIRTQLSRGEADACLRSIEVYAEQHRSGAFVQEVEVMRIEALATSGKRDAARAAGRQFLSQYPTSPYADRVRSVLGESQ